MTDLHREEEAAALNGNRCGSCKFWNVSPRDPLNLGAPRMGECRGVPPVPLLIGSQPTPQGLRTHIQTVFPQLHENAPACGMHTEVLELHIN